MTRPGESSGFEQIGHSDLNGRGDGSQVMREGDVLYVGHFGTTGMGTSILDVSDPSEPVVVRQWETPPGSHTHKVQTGDGLLLVNEEPFRGGTPHTPGMRVYDLGDPLAPERIGTFSPGGMGVHRIVWTGGDYAYVSATPPGFDTRIWMVVDMRDPEHPVEAARWWWPGPGPGDDQPASRQTWKGYAAHHALIDGDRAYLGYGDAGLVVLDISDISTPRALSTLSWSPGGNTHTCMPLPGRGLLVVTDEETENNCAGGPHFVRVVDVGDSSAPEVVAVCPAPEGDFCERGLRFGPHNTHENRPGSYRSAEVVFVTYFNAGLRVYDLADPSAPVEIAHWIPDCPAGQPDVMVNDVFVAADGLVFVTERISGGVYILQPQPELRRRMEAAAL